MCKKSGLLLFYLFSAWVICRGQPCDLSLSGWVSDYGTGIALEFANVLIEETGLGTNTDSTGFFELVDVCPGSYHLRISHLGCESAHQFILLRKDTSIRVGLNHHTELLDEVIVQGSQQDNTSATSKTLRRELITTAGGKNISDLLEQISGVSVLRNGSGISKPVIHGLYGNRIAILNNGLLQSGQQWGNDHAPEIDQLLADHLSVVKGSAALAYGGNSLGSVVVVETANIQPDPHQHGEFYYALQSNGWGHSFNTRLEKSGRLVAWRVGGTLKWQGDTQSPGYLLKNTGIREQNLALQFQKQFSEKWKTEAYYSLFSTNIGILRGAHIGNITDLQQAIGREEPFFTTDTFSYQIGVPRQHVIHHLLKLESTYFLKEQSLLKFKYGSQLNQRKEFDVRRSGRDEVPALSLQQWSHFAEGVLHKQLAGKGLLKAGLQLNVTDNTNNPETGIFPLIPDYRSFNSSAFLIGAKETADLLFDFGGRYDLQQLNVVTFSKTVPRVVERFNHQFHKVAFNAGARFRLIPQLEASMNAGYVLRSPEVNELYSAGLHQGVSGIEEGDRLLKAEHSAKAILSINWALKNKLFIQSLVYHQHITNFIYLQPQREFRLTIRGAFPVFVYKQTDAQLSGMDLLLKYEPGARWQGIVKYALVRGRNMKERIPLINIPPDNVFGSLTYIFKNGKTLQNTNFGVNVKYVFQQSQLLSWQDFLPPPNAYTLLGIRLSSHIQLKKARIKLALQLENLLNHRYRDYLNRLRYFADELGRNGSLSIGYIF